LFVCGGLFASFLTMANRAALGADAPTTAPSAPLRLNLWENTPHVVAGPDTDVDPTIPTIDVYQPPKATATNAAVLVLPGGGYTHLSTQREGSDVAAVLVQHNITAVVLRYRHSPRYMYPIPIDDGMRAVRLVRSKAADWGINPSRIGIMGFSAGGHLAATVSTSFDAGNPAATDPVDKISSRPDFSVLVYPVITFVDPATHVGSRTALVGNDQALWTKMSAELNVTRNTPPVFIVHSSADRTVPPMNSLLYYTACLKAGVPAQLLVFDHGGHGFGLGPDNDIKNWPNMVVQWMASNKWIPPVPTLK
jgi:acetyl esterase/lipase